MEVPVRFAGVPIVLQPNETVKETESPAQLLRVSRSILDGLPPEFDPYAARTNDNSWI